jgi:hypothetical protein
MGGCVEPAVAGVRSQPADFVSSYLPPRLPPFLLFLLSPSLC